MSLIDLCKENDVQLSSLQALTNLSVMEQNHPPYTQLVNTLYSLLDHTENPPARLQALRILVNLASNPSMVPHLMAAKVSVRSCDFISFSNQYVVKWKGY